MKLMKNEVAKNAWRNVVDKICHKVRNKIQHKVCDRVWNAIETIIWIELTHKVYNALEKPHETNERKS